MRIPARLLRYPLVLIAGAVALSACSSGSNGPSVSAPATGQTAPDGSAYPIDVQNCGRTLHFDKAPSRVVSGWTTSTELLLELDLGDRIVGQYNTASGTPKPEHAAAEKRIPVLGDNAPTRESLAAARPDLIWADGSYLFDGQQLPTIEELKDDGIQVMILSGFCTDDATSARVGDVRTEIESLGRIFGVEGQAANVLSDVDARLSEVAASIKGKPEVPLAVVSTFDRTIYAYAGVYTDIAELAGGRNIYADTLPAGQYYSELSVEDIIKSDPTTLVYLLSGTETASSAEKFLREAMPTVAAVRTGDVVYLPSSDSTNLAGVDGVVALASALHP